MAFIKCLIQNAGIIQERDENCWSNLIKLLIADIINDNKLSKVVTELLNRGS